MFAEVMPPMGPTAWQWWQGMNSTSPASSILTASSSVSAQPSKSAAPMHEPRMGPCMFSQVMGGPACRRVFFSRLSSGMTSLATTTSTSCGWLSLKRWQMRSLASSMPST